MQFTPEECAALSAIEAADDRYDALQALLAEDRLDPLEPSFFGEVTSDFFDEFVALIKASSDMVPGQSRRDRMAAAAEFLLGKAESRRIEQAEAELNQREREWRWA